MKGVMRFAKIIILTGCLVFLGLNTAAQGLQKMSPDISHDFLGFTSHNQIWTVTALGKEYHWEANKALNTISYLKVKADQSADQVKRSVFFWGDFLLEKGERYFPYWEKRLRKLFFTQEKANFSFSAVHVGFIGL